MRHSPRSTLNPHPSTVAYHPFPTFPIAFTAGNRNNGNAKRAPRAPREFEGSVEGTEGGRARPRNADRRKPKDGEGGRRNDRADRSGRG